MIIDNYPGLIN